jgi:hypothetical protein
VISISISAGVFAMAVGCTRGPSRASLSADASTPPPRWSYEIRIDEALERMNLGLCIEGPPPGRLITADDGLEFVRSATVREGPALVRSEDGFVIETLGEHGCVDLEIDLAAATAADGRDAVRSGDTLLLGPGRWLWYPDDVREDVDARARFELPEGVAVTAPWPLEPDGWRRLDRTSFGWGAWIAIGRYEPIEFRVGQCEFEVAVLDGERAATDAGIEAWLRVAAEVSAELHGRFPRERVAVVVIPRSGWGNAPVLFGMARRGGGASAMLLLDRDAEDHELIGEWVASHELLHLGMPWIRDPWMGEGFVTYYSTILSARRGVFVNDAPPERQVEAALEDLAVGFRRGHGGADRETLAHASETMHSSHSYRRVYWGGAAVAFDLDLRIRRASGNRRSLDDLVRTLAPHAPAYRTWTASEVIEHMEAELQRWKAAGELDADVSLSLAKIVARHLDASSIPARIARLEGLALEVDSGRVRLLAAPSDEVRTRTRLFESSAAKRDGFGDDALAR